MLKLYMILMFMERWGPAAGCGDYGQVNWEDLSEDAKEIVVWKKFCSGTVLGTGERGQGVTSVPGAIFDFVVLESEWWKKLAGFLYTKYFKTYLVVVD